MMKKLIAALAGIALVAGSIALIVPHKAQAAITVMCAPRPPAANAGPRQITIPTTSQTQYSLDSNGCAPIQDLNDVGYLISQGFLQGAGVYTAFALTSSATAATAVITLPAATRIDSVVIQEIAGNSVTGGIKIGTTNGGNDVVAGITCGASCLATATDVSMAKRVFSAFNSQPIFVGAVNSYNSANVWVTIRYSYF